jgi:hypothetical protein
MGCVSLILWPSTVLKISDVLIIFSWYEHSWDRPDDEEVWKRFWPQLVADAALIVDAADVPLQCGYDDRSPPLLSVESGISLNGVWDEPGYYHATFSIGPSGYAGSCNTMGEPYDLVVATILLRASVLMGDAFCFSSDGVWEHPRWRDARQLFWKVWPDVELPPELLPLGAFPDSDDSTVEDEDSE